MENLSDYSNFVNAAYMVVALATVGLLVQVVIKYFKVKKKLNAK